MQGEGRSGQGEVQCGDWGEERGGWSEGRGGWSVGRGGEALPLLLRWQVLHNLSLWTANKKPLTDQVAKTDASRARKEVKLVGTHKGGRRMVVVSGWSGDGHVAFASVPLSVP